MIIKQHDMYVKFKSFDFKLLRKFVIQYDIRIWFDKRSWV